MLRTSTGIVLAFFIFVSVILCPVALAQEPDSLPEAQPQKSALVERVGATGFIQLEAESFKQLTPRQQALAYWLSQAAIAINPIIKDAKRSSPFYFS